MKQIKHVQALWLFTRIALQGGSATMAASHERKERRVLVHQVAWFAVTHIQQVGVPGAGELASLPMLVGLAACLLQPK
eukprot:4695130-Amphidinium_carterae.1